jgi:hypothetical protein
MSLSKSPPEIKVKATLQSEQVSFCGRKALLFFMAMEMKTRR